MSAGGKEHKPAAEANPFDLTDRSTGGPERPHRARTWTAPEIAARLTGYIEVSRDHWEAIRYGTHVRYVVKSGEFRPGGFVMKNPLDVKPKGEASDKRFIKLQNGFSPAARGYAAWVQAYEDLEKVYVKPDAGVLTVLDMVESGVRGLNLNIQKLAEHSKRLEARIAELEGRRS